MKLDTIRLPVGPGELEQYVVGPSKDFPTVSTIVSRKAYAAAHIVADPLAEVGELGAAIDWETTLRFREYLWSLGFGVA
jgi:hypothetical protein